MSSAQEVKAGSIFVVLDECWNPCHCDSRSEACHEHINDAISQGIEEAAQWVVREYVQVIK